MKIAMGSDHAGFELKEAVKAQLEDAGHEVEDVGTNSSESTDYPPFAAKAAELVARGEAEKGVIVCGSGVGVSIVANKVDGVRAVNAQMQLCFRERYRLCRGGDAFGVHGRFVLGCAVRAVVCSVGRLLGCTARV